MNLSIYRNRSIVAQFPIDEGAVHVQGIRGEDFIRVDVNLRKSIDIKIGDFIIRFGRKFFLNRLPDVVKTSNITYAYSIVFEAESYDLTRVSFLHDGASQFSINLDLDGFIDLIVQNLNRVFGAGSWSKGAFTQSDSFYRLISFRGENCMQALIRISEEFSGEASFQNKAISFSDIISTSKNISMEYYNGLREINRTSISSDNITTVLHAFGSEKNLTTSYGHTRLLPSVSGGKRTIENNVDLYGIFERTVFFDDIFPTRTGTLTSVDASDVRIFRDNSMDFNVNDHLIGGVTVKIVFQTGDLAGYEFEIFSYDDATKEFDIIELGDKQEYILPSNLLRPRVGDTYKLIDLYPPQSYFADAERRLRDKAEEWIRNRSSPLVEYRITPDWKWLRDQKEHLQIGDSITVKDIPLGINTQQRIIRIERQLVFQWRIQIDVTNAPEPDIDLLLPSRVVDNNQTIQDSDLEDVGRRRRNKVSVGELSNILFNPDSPTRKIRGGLLSIPSLAVGYNSTNFALDVVISPNYEGDENAFYSGAGTLTHFNIDDTSIFTWGINENNYSSLNPSSTYYIYVKVRRDTFTHQDNEVVLDTAQRKVDDQADLYYFLIGVLHSVVDERRAYSPIYGQTTIHGGFITTGRIQSRSGGTYFDLDEGQLHVGSASKYLDWNGSRLEIRGDFQTSTGTGKRVELSGEENRLRFYSSDGTEIIRIDDTHSNLIPQGISIISEKGPGPIAPFSSEIRISGGDFFSFPSGNEAISSLQSGIVFLRNSRTLLTLRHLGGVFNPLEIQDNTGTNLLYVNPAGDISSQGLRISGTLVINSSRNITAQAISATAITGSTLLASGIVRADGGFDVGLIPVINSSAEWVGVDITASIPNSFTITGSISAASISLSGQVSALTGYWIGPTRVINSSGQWVGASISTSIPNSFSITGSISLSSLTASGIVRADGGFRVGLSQVINSSRQWVGQTISTSIPNSFSITGSISCSSITSGSYRVGGNTVVGSRKSSISPPSQSFSSLQSAVNSLISRLVSHGLISTWIP